MTWKELCEKAIQLGYSLKNDDELCKEIDGKRMRFFIEGTVFCYHNIIRKDRTPDQMWQIIEALQ